MLAATPLASTSTPSGITAAATAAEVEAPAAAPPARIKANTSSGAVPSSRAIPTRTAAWPESPCATKGADRRVEGRRIRTHQQAATGGIAHDVGDDVALLVRPHPVGVQGEVHGRERRVRGQEEAQDKARGHPGGVAAREAQSAHEPERPGRGPGRSPSSAAARFAQATVREAVGGEEERRRARARPPRRRRTRPRPPGPDRRAEQDERGGGGRARARQRGTRRALDPHPVHAHRAAVAHPLESQAAVVVGARVDVRHAHASSQGLGVGGGSVRDDANGLRLRPRRGHGHRDADRRARPQSGYHQARIGTGHAEARRLERAEVLEEGRVHRGGGRYLGHARAAIDGGQSQPAERHRERGLPGLARHRGPKPIPERCCSAAGWARSHVEQGGAAQRRRVARGV